MGFMHGTWNSYNNGCRCDDCRRANTERQAAKRAARKARGCPPETHGTAAGYSEWGCRCTPCREAESARRDYRDYYRRHREHEIRRAKLNYEKKKLGITGETVIVDAF